MTAPFRFIGKVVLQLFWYATDTSPGHALVLGWQILRSLSLDPLKGPTTQEQDDCRILNKSGLFDVDWYLKQYLGLRPSRRDPVLHYLRYGAAQGLNPSPLFDARDYLFSNPDVAAANMNPLLHYALHGRLEGRKGGVLSERRQVTPIKEVARSIETDFSIAVPLDFTPTALTQTPSLAIVCHIFHEELTPEFQRYFKNISFPFDVFISTNTSAKKIIIERFFTGWKRGKVEVRVTKNRGRDIAPKLLGFSDVYQQYEFILHLHSKTSNHTSTLAVWRRVHS